MNFLIKTFRILFCLTLLFTLTHCFDDDSGDTDTNEIDITDPNAVNDAISITGATEVAGNPPAPSTDLDAPVINSSDNLVTSQGGNPTLRVDVSSGDVAGIYLQIAGADSYYDIPASAFTGGRIAQVSQDEPAIEIAIPDDMQPGIFCADYCIYDSELRVSNIVTVCIEVTSFGGENSDFLLGTWEIVTITETDGVETEVIQVGTDVSEYTFNVNWGCGDGTFQDLQVTETEFYDFIRLTFSEGGAVRFQSSYEDRIFDNTNTTCQGVVYIEDSGTEDVTGAWSYDQSTSRLILVLDFGDDEGEEVNDFTIFVDGNTMTAIQEFGFGETDTIVLEKQ